MVSLSTFLIKTVPVCLACAVFLAILDRNLGLEWQIIQGQERSENVNKSATFKGSRPAHLDPVVVFHDRGPPFCLLSFHFSLHQAEGILLWWPNLVAPLYWGRKDWLTKHIYVQFVERNCSNVDGSCHLGLCGPCYSHPNRTSSGENPTRQ